MEDCLEAMACRRSSVLGVDICANFLISEFHFRVCARVVTSVMVIHLPELVSDDQHHLSSSCMNHVNAHPVVVSPGDLREFLDYSSGCGGVSKSLGLSIAFGIAGSVLFGALGAAVKYVSEKVEEQRNSK